MSEDGIEIVSLDETNIYSKDAAPVWYFVAEIGQVREE